MVDVKADAEPFIAGHDVGELFRRVAEARAREVLDANRDAQGFRNFRKGNERFLGTDDALGAPWFGILFQAGMDDRKPRADGGCRADEPCVNLRRAPPHVRIERCGIHGAVFRRKVEREMEGADVEARVPGARGERRVVEAVVVPSRKRKLDAVDAGARQRIEEVPVGIVDGESDDQGFRFLDMWFGPLEREPRRPV